MPKTWKRLVELVVAKGGAHHQGTKIEFLTHKSSSLMRQEDGTIYRNEPGIQLDLLTNMRVKDAYEYFKIKEE